MATTRGHDILTGHIYHRKKGTAFKKRVVRVFCGVREGSVSSRVVVFQDYKKAAKPAKLEHSIKLEGAKVHLHNQVRHLQNADSFSVTTSNGEMHGFKFESGSQRLHWVNTIKLLVKYPYSMIPQ